METLNNTVVHVARRRERRGWEGRRTEETRENGSGKQRRVEERGEEKGEGTENNTVKGRRREEKRKARQSLPQIFTQVLFLT